MEMKRTMHLMILPEMKELEIQVIVKNVTGDGHSYLSENPTMAEHLVNSAVAGIRGRIPTGSLKVSTGHD